MDKDQESEQNMAMIITQHDILPKNVMGTGSQGFNVVVSGVLFLIRKCLRLCTTKR